MLSRFAVIALLFLSFVAAVPHSFGALPSPRSSQLRNLKRDGSTRTACGAPISNGISAPKENIFHDLTNEEAAAVTAFLHDQKSLNVTAVVNATDWDNVILWVGLLQPNKTDALSYLDGYGRKPARYARARISFGATLQPYIQEFMVGPLPVAKGKTTVQPLNYIFNGPSGGRVKNYAQDVTAFLAFITEIGKDVADLTQTLINGTFTGAANDTIQPASNNNFIHENGHDYVWIQFIGVPTDVFVSFDILPTGFEFKVDLTGRDPSKWKVAAWWYNNIYAESLPEFRRAVRGHKAPVPVDGPWTSTDQAGPKLPRDQLSPPIEVSPDGPRYGVDPKAQYVEWMDFSFYVGFTHDTGMQLFNIKYKGERIIYELSLQEAVAQYASADPFQSTTAYLDSSLSMGLTSFELVPGFDCPEHATYMNVSVNDREVSHTLANAICLFEHDTGYPIQRHSTAGYVSSTKNIVFTMRYISTVGNYDYIFDYTFQLDGSILVEIRASGYIQGSIWANHPEYGFHIYDGLSGSLHDHVLNYKLDLDVHGTSNSLMRTQVVPTTEKYEWAKAPRNTMKLQRSFVPSESDINFAGNGVDFYSVVNKAKPNKYGEYPGWRLMSSNAVHSVAQNSANLGPSLSWGYKDFYVTKQKDSELSSAWAYNFLDAQRPAINFGKYLDGESLDQEDIVVHFNLGMHHLPHTGDLPNTVTTTARSSMYIIPQNYLPGDPSRQTVHQVRVNQPANGTSAEVLTFGAKPATCSVDLGALNPDLTTYKPEGVQPKYPFIPMSEGVGAPPGNFDMPAQSASAAGPAASSAG